MKLEKVLDNNYGDDERTKVVEGEHQAAALAEDLRVNLMRDDRPWYRKVCRYCQRRNTKAD